jgi:mono/diheme cytochrome c family protein
MRRYWKQILLAVVGIGIVAALGALAWAHQPAIAAIARPDPRGFDPDLVRRGAVLAQIGDCAVCHTNPGGGAFAGGRPLPTPFGTLFVTNITPDEATGIGSWSAAAFRRAMREGVSRDGHHLYPALPYEHFTRVADADLDAIYAFLMTRQPVRAAAPPNALIPPLGFRPVLAGWKLLFLREGPLPDDPAQSEEWRRGAYLAEGLGHCGGCHRPRNLAGAERRDRGFAGGIAEGYDAPPLDATNPSAGRWSVDSLTTYLRTGMQQGHGVAAGPMGPVAHSLSQVPEADVRAIAVYVAAGMRGAATPATAPSPAQTPAQITAQAAEAARRHPVGASLFAGACGGCHGSGAPMLARDRADLSVVTALRAPEATNAVQAVIRGFSAPTGPERPFMPPFAAGLTDAQLAEILTYARARFTDRPAWPDLAKTIARIRQEDRQP